MINEKDKETEPQNLRKSRIDFEITDGTIDTETIFDMIGATKLREFYMEENMKKLSSLVDLLNTEYERLLAENMAVEYMETNSAVSAVLALRDKGLVKGIRGTVMELGTVDPEWEIAFGAAMGGRMQNIVVENDQVATDVIKHLMREKLGKVTFLPMNKTLEGKPRAKAIMIEKDVVGYAIDLLRFDPEYKAVFWNVLGDTLIVDTLEQARTLMGGVRIVTKTGEVLEASDTIFEDKIRKQKIRWPGATPEAQMNKIDAGLRMIKDLLKTLGEQAHEMHNRIEDMERKHMTDGTRKVRGLIQ